MNNYDHSLQSISCKKSCNSPTKKLCHLPPICRPPKRSEPPHYPYRQPSYYEYNEDNDSDSPVDDFHIPINSVNPLNDNEVKSFWNACSKPQLSSNLLESSPNFSTLSNDQYEEDVDQWFSKTPSNPSPPIPIPPIPPPVPLPPPEGPLPPLPPFFLTKQYSPEHSAFPEKYPSTADNIRHCTAGWGPHDPRGNALTRSTNWSIAHWDGIPFDMTGKTKEEIHKFLVPDHQNNKYAIRGLEEYFYRRKPFADNNNPTVAEIDTWNLEVIRHIRSVLGVKVTTGPTTGLYYGKDIPIIPDARLYLECAWADGRKHSQMWDEIYSGGVIKNGIENFGFAPGPCWLPLPPPNPNPSAVRPPGYTPHCGETFAPRNPYSLKYREAAPYFFQTSSWGQDYYDTLPPNDPLRFFRANFYATNPPYKELYQHGTLASSSAGLSGTGPDVPWSHKMAMIFANFIKDEGTSGHAGPFLSRPYVGMSWSCNEDGIAFRGKWAGRIRADNGNLDIPFLGWTKIE
jgi:hypothetical protein